MTICSTGLYRCQRQILTIGNFSPVILYRYFAREIFVTTLAVASIVLVISMGWRFTGYLNEAAGGTMSKDILFMLMAYRIPGFLELILPISFFLSIMLVYGRLYVDSEMVVLESCGISPSRLVGMTLLNSVVILLITAAISLWIKPFSEAEVETMFEGQRNLTEFDTLAPGRFQALKSGKRVTYTESLSSDGNLEGVFMNEYQEKAEGESQDVITLIAETGETVVDNNGNRFLVLKDGKRFSGKAGEKAYQVIDYAEYGQFIEKEQSHARDRRRGAVPTIDLIREPGPKYTSELQWRISVVLMIPIIAIMAVPLSKVNPRQGRFSRLLPGMVLCFMYVGFLSAARAAVEKQQIPVSMGIWWVHGIYIVLVAGLFRLEQIGMFFGRLLPAPRLRERSAPRGDG
ncbi:MAG: LPS export ABC transporter permease LptF [Pseudomonadales bacterium]|nr:LPS export ABC transporter permease LptF [Pseudomonadales bacterium]